MNYKKIYDDLMQSRLLMKEARISARKAGEYFEAHHIVPVSMGGDGKAHQLKHSNIVLLTGREHYIAHALLFIIYKNKQMTRAFHAMCIQKKSGKRNFKISARLYQELKIEVSKLGIHPNAKKSIIAALKGKPMSEETKMKISLANKGKKFPFKHRKKQTIENRKKRSDRMKLVWAMKTMDGKKYQEPDEKFLNKKRTKDIIDLLNSGYGVRQIQRTLNCSPNLVVKIKTKLNMTKCHST